MWYDFSEKVNEDKCLGDETLTRMTDGKIRREIEKVVSIDFKEQT